MSHVARQLITARRAAQLGSLLCFHWLRHNHFLAAVCCRLRAEQEQEQGGDLGIALKNVHALQHMVIWPPPIVSHIDMSAVAER